MKNHGPNRNEQLLNKCDGAVVLCPECNGEMRLFGIEWETESRDLYTFECKVCERFDVKGVSEH